MDLRQMEYLVALAEERNFTRAAELTRISQSGFSAAIRTLEEEMGAQLFRRTTRRVEATEAGLALLPHARAMLQQAASARDAVVQASQAVAGTLRIGSEQCLGVVDINPLLERFHRRHPAVETHFAQRGSQELMSMVRDGELDVALVATRGHFGSLTHRELGREPLVFLAHEGHELLSGRRPVPAGPAQGVGAREAQAVQWADLADREFVDFGPSWGIRELTDAAFEFNGVHRRVRCTVNDVHTLLDLVARRLGVAVVPRHVAMKPQAQGLMMLALPRSGTPEWTVSVVTAGPERAEAPARHLLGLLEGAPACSAEPAPLTGAAG
ncbi:LysR family transcriptional regulator [Zhihengliuella flava]|uniref:DNA-binding transcriptional LysR family regulator n=1 Tax=Zhihengliuella flava TaxID=1285193 RepID=A0A931D665_9MICC|nr:LysR family transcriptional regulator [Zhihengliuella flava]MBG6084430.1 DNA-binding transcriptional LysR family regulator [Zhihengliuella flava]